MQGWEGAWYCPRCNCAWELQQSDAGNVEILREQIENDYYTMACPNCKTPTHRAALTVHEFPPL